MKNHNSKIQYESPEVIKKFQEEKLRETLSFLAANSLFYRDMFRRNKIDVSRIKTIEDLQLIPTTDKTDLQTRNADFLCAPLEKAVDIVTTSGTLGEPVVFYLTENDLQRLAYNEKLSFETVGLDSSDVMQLMTTIDRRFMAGLAYFLGARDLGMSICRVGNGIPELQWDTINRIHPTVAMMVPSFACKLIDYAKTANIDFKKSSLKKFICIGEALRKTDFTLNTLGERIASQWNNIELYSTYASTEMQTSFTECREGKGGHLPPELIIAEFLDADERPVKPGEEGEVTITTLGVEGMPLLRFKTGDIVIYHTEPCACGRNTIRLSSVTGRKGQMVKFKGTTLYPPALYDVIDSIPEVVNYIVEVFHNELGTDEILIRVGTNHRSEQLEKHIKDVFRAKIRVAPAIVFESVEYINTVQFPQTKRKSVKFIDRRDN
ncbi:MAG: AMP-binding protein [Dysgonamonadaceae bacterium]|jgi:phenylacetate-CoA ligase|nr:AMP-binding protein [Dysgonamonadaceae bacterium]